MATTTGTTTTPSTSGNGMSPNIGALLGAGLGSSLLTSLLGGSGPSLDQAGSITQGSQQIGAQGQNLANAGQNLVQQGQAYTPAWLKAVQEYQDALNVNPNTDSFATGQIARQLGGINQDYDQQQAQAESELSARGILQPGGGPNSTESGLVQGFGAAKAGALGQARNAYANNAIEQRLRNLGIGAQLAGNTQNQLVTQGNQTVGTGANIENMSIEQLLALQQQQLQAQQAAAASSAGLGSAIGGIAGLAASFF